MIGKNEPRERKMRIRCAMSVIGAFAAQSVIFSKVVAAPDTDEFTAVRDELWALEQSIYANRREGNLQPYLDRASEAYLGPHSAGGWEPGTKKLEEIAKNLEGKAKEKLAMHLRAFSMHGDTAVIYYHNNRTMLPDGTKVDEWYEVMHVWVRENDDWVLLASVPRLMRDYTPPEEALSDVSEE